MTVTNNNPHQFSKQGNTANPEQITDAHDFPHTGLIKGLSQMARQNIVVKGSNNTAAHDFNITQTGSGQAAATNTIQVATGSYLRDGKLYTAEADNFSIGSTSNSTSLLLHNSFDKGYHILVVDASNDLKIRQPTAANAIPQYNLGDTLIAIIEISSSTDNGARFIQYLTSDKTSNSVSIAYNASNTYTEALSIESSASGHVTIESKVSDKDIIIKGNDGGSAITALTLDMSDAGSANFNDKVTIGEGKLVLASTAVTSSAAELNKLDGATLSTAQLNRVDATSSIQTQLDSKAIRTGDQSFAGSLVIDKDRASSVTGAEDITTLHVDFDRVTQSGGTGAHNDIGIDLDVTSSSKGTSTAIGMDIDVVGAGDGTQVVKGLTVDVSGGNTNYAAIFNGGNVGIGTSTPAAPLHVVSTDDGETLRLESTDADDDLAPDLIFKRTSSSPATGESKRCNP